LSVTHIHFSLMFRSLSTCAVFLLVLIGLASTGKAPGNPSKSMPPDAPTTIPLSILAMPGVAPPWPRRAPGDSRPKSELAPYRESNVLYEMIQRLRDVGTDLMIHEQETRHSVAIWYHSTPFVIQVPLILCATGAFLAVARHALRYTSRSLF
jgi:hypothetical protein